MKASVLALLSCEL